MTKSKPIPAASKGSSVDRPELSPRSGPKGRVDKSLPRASVRKETAISPKTKVTTGARSRSKIAKVVDLLRKPGGTTINAMVAATGWQAHSVRGAISGAIKKRLGLNVSSEGHGKTRVYRIGR